MKENDDTLESTAQQFKQSAAAGEEEQRITPETFPAALPRLMLVTLRSSMQPDFGLTLEAALRGGARLIQLRERELPIAEIEELARVTATLCARYGAQWLWNGDETTARTLGADGVHWPQSMIPARPPAHRSKILRGASVHSLEPAQRAIVAGADYLVFGSVWETASHPGATAAGIVALQEFCASCVIPIFAIGGVTAERAALCRKAGAHGVAVMRAVWDADNIAKAASTLVTSSA